MLESQNHKCAICGIEIKFLKGKKSLGRGNYGRGNAHIDHDHNTKEIRGILCANCNIGIGNLQEDTNIIASALKYLKRFSKRKSSNHRSTK